MVRASLLDQVELTHGFSTELCSPADHEAFARELEMARRPRARLRQVHGREVVVVDGDFDLTARHTGDALVTTSTDIALTIAHADCVPVLLADVEAGVIGAAHAGWRGMHARVVVRVVEIMVAHGAHPARVRAAIGPAVGAGCYVVGEEVRDAYRRSFPDADSLFDDGKLDLHAAAEAELRRAGLTPHNIQTLPLCTHCEPRFASHRRQGIERGTNLALIARREATTPAEPR